MVYLRQHHDDDALVEPFLDSREFQVAVWGNDVPEALPPAEIDYSTFPDVRDRLYTEAWKFDRASLGYLRVQILSPAPLDRPDWRARLETVAVRAYQALGLRDYARLDMRMLGDEPQILDVNVNPDLLADGHSAFVARRTGRRDRLRADGGEDSRVRGRPHAVSHVCGPRLRAAHASLPYTHPRDSRC